MGPEENSRLEREILARLGSYNRWTKTWSGLYHSFLIASILLSGSAALLLELPSLEEFSGWSAVFAGLAAVVSTLGALMQFEKKWRVNQVSRTHLEKLRIEIQINPEADHDKIRKRYVEVIEMHDKGIVESLME